MDTLPLVMLPGTLCDARIFAPLRQRLPQYPTQVIVTTHARSLVQAADQVLSQAPEHFALLGFSLGGMVAMEAALRAPERVRALALISTTPFAVPPERHAGRRALVEEACMLSMRQFVRERLWAEYGGRSGDTCTLPLLEEMAEDLGAATFAAQTEMALGRSDFCPRLAAIAVPTLVVGGVEDSLCPPDAQAKLSAALSADSFVLLPGCGHFAVFERPDEVAAPVAAWLHTIHAARNRFSAGVRSDTEVE